MFNQDQEIFNILLEAVSEGVIIVDNHQKIMEVNSFAETIFGYAKNEILDKELNLLIPSHFHSSHSVYFEKFVKRGKRRKMGEAVDIFGLKKDGTVFPVEVELNPFTIYNKTYVMAMVRDISEKQKIEERTQQLKTALSKEKELNELKTQFLSLVSHEFKTPLSGILTSSQLLGKYTLTEQQEKRDKHIKTITDKVHYLNNILNDFLSFEKLESGKVNYRFAHFKLSKVINEVVYNANMLLKEGQQINYPQDIDDFSMFQDEKITELILSNLLYNAINYSPEHTTIDIEVKQNSETTTFKIKDQGIGIPEKDQKHIFERYFRAENVLNTQGTGIGLNIVKNHLENIGGTISFSSKENKGSTFIITFPNTAQQ
ncbi:MULTISPECIES: PAS domain-containing sensor histidine kinase [Hwangdonia]|uniref:histidine kinase n=1 Tax=Hwangdonia seohaensis TaxID=1240727 RepID=A0ABW3RFU4_9FLAO|nr:PAS domain-containing sensor histidine kinase [Hwangdonia seohaensis]